LPTTATAAGGSTFEPAGIVFAVQAEAMSSATRTTFRKLTEIERMRNTLLAAKSRVEKFVQRKATPERAG
jgi:hypothetical protein